MLSVNSVPSDLVSTLSSHLRNGDTVATANCHRLRMLKEKIIGKAERMPAKKEVLVPVFLVTILD